MSKRAQHIVTEWGVTILILLFGSMSVGWSFVVPTGSMEDTILIGDHLVVDKLAYAPPGPVSKHLLPYSDVKRGDIVVFRYPLNIQENYVKRVVGVPGDRIKIVAKQLYRNGEPVNEPYKIHRSSRIEYYRDYFPVEGIEGLRPRAARMLAEHVTGGELVVPPRQYFVMGDNRDESDDSRFWGLVPRENIFGKPWLIYWSYESAGDLRKAVDLDHLRDIAFNLFSKTRWERTLRTIRAHSTD